MEEETKKGKRGNISPVKKSEPHERILVFQEVSRRESICVDFSKRRKISL